MTSTEKDLLLLLKSQHRQSIFESLTPLEYLLFVKDRNASKKWIAKGDKLIEVLTKLPFKQVEFNGEEPDRKRMKKETTLHYDLTHDLRIKIVDFLLKSGTFLNENFAVDIAGQNDFIGQCRSLVRNVTELDFKVVEIEDFIPIEPQPPLPSTIPASIDTNQPMVAKEFEFEDMSTFFKGKKVKESDFFYCNGTPFFLSLAVTTRKDGKKFLKIFLQIQNFVFESKWSCKCWYSIILISRERSLDQYEDFNHTFLDNYGFGESEFISMEKLFETKGKFFHDGDKIKLRVHLKADNIVFEK